MAGTRMEWEWQPACPTWREDTESRGEEWEERQQWAERPWVWTVQRKMDELSWAWHQPTERMGNGETEWDR